MMKKILHGTKAVMIAALGLMLTACEYKDLGDFGRGKIKKIPVTLHFDWQQVDSIPNSMRVVFYPDDKTNYAQGYTFFDVLNCDTTIQLPAGGYSLTAWNNDCEHVIVSHFSKQEATYATTGNYSPHGNVNIPKVLDSLYHDQKVLDYPDYMVHANLFNFLIEENKPNQVITLTPDSMVVTVEVKLHGIKGLEWCQNIRGAINNVAGKRYIAFDNLTEDKVAIMFDAEPVQQDSMVVAKFWVFGIEPTDLSHLDHKLVMFFWITGNQVFIPIDVTDIIANARKDDTYVLIETPDLDIDLSKYVRQGETGIIVDAEDWEETEEITLSF